MGKKSDLNYKIKKSYHFGQYLLAHFNPFYKNNMFASSIHEIS